MPYAMNDPRYYYKPRTAVQRHAQSLRERRRLGIPSDCVRIYGVHVPTRLETPLRQYAAWLRHKSGLEAAVSFVHKAIELDGRIAKPSPDKITKTDPRYVYSPRPLTVERLRKRQWRNAIGEFRRAIRAAWKDHRAQFPPQVGADWGLVDALLSEYATREEVARFLGITEGYLRRKMQQRKRAGLSTYSGRKGYA